MRHLLGPIGFAVGCLFGALIGRAEAHVDELGYLIPERAPRPGAVLADMMDGTCRVYVRLYGTDAVVTLSSGECLVAMGAAGRFLGEPEILSGPLGKTGEKL